MKVRRSWLRCKCSISNRNCSTKYCQFWRGILLKPVTSTPSEDSWSFAWPKQSGSSHYQNSMPDSRSWWIWLSSRAYEAEIYHIERRREKPWWSWWMKSLLGSYQSFLRRWRASWLGDSNSMCICLPFMLCSRVWQRIRHSQPVVSPAEWSIWTQTSCWVNCSVSSMRRRTTHRTMTWSSSRSPRIEKLFPYSRFLQSIPTSSHLSWICWRQS